MQHCDPEQLALLALGESGTDEPADEAARAHLAHLAQCDECQHELAALAHVVRMGRAGDPSGELATPPPKVWAGIAAELGIDPNLLGGNAGVAGRAASAGHRRWAGRTRFVATAAGVVGLVVGLGLGGGAAWLLTNDGSGSGKGAGVVATAALKPLAVPAARGTAVVSRESSRRVLTIQLRGLSDQPGTFYEVWLLDRRAGKLIALGVLGPGEKGTYSIPVGLDLAQYPVVDVSLQPLNGNPKHSGDSVVRGLLG